MLLGRSLQALPLLCCALHSSNPRSAASPSRPHVKLCAPATSATLREPICNYFDIVIPAPADGPPSQEITVVDLMPYIHERLRETGLHDGTVTVISRHTTTAITMCAWTASTNVLATTIGSIIPSEGTRHDSRWCSNEWESRLARDLRTWLLQIAPPDDRSSIGAGANVRYEHNDIDERPESEDERQRCLDNGWDVDDPRCLERWRDQEPINAHSHLAAMLLGSSESIPVTSGEMVLGQWQSVMLVDVDGPRERKVGLQVFGFK